MTTERQRQANRANAQHSTGPRTDTGKAASARNATKHGCYSTSLAAIPRGAFSESQEELDAFMAAMVADLKPRDTIERCITEDIAALFWKVRRLGVFEAEAVADAAPTHSLLLSIETGPHAAREIGATKVLNDVLEAVARIDRSLSRRIDDALRRYALLRERPLTTSPAEP